MLNFEWGAACPWASPTVAGERLAHELALLLSVILNLEFGMLNGGGGLAGKYA